MKKAFLFLFFGLMLSFLSEAQTMDLNGDRNSQEKKDSIEEDELNKIKVKPRISLKRDFQYGLDSFYTQDSSFYNFHRFNPVYKNYRGVQDLGFTGSAYKGLLYSRNKEIGFAVGENSLNHMQRTSKSTNYYEAQVPFTKFYYTQGKEAMIHLKAFHTQNILPNWNVAADYSSFKSDGIYLRQAQKIKTTQVSSKYSTLNGRYLITGSFNWNRLTSQESGGIVNDTLFENADRLNKNVPNNLSLAQNNLKTREHNLYQHIKLGKKIPLFREKDTISQIPKSVILFHEMDWNRYVYHFTDQNLADSFHLTRWYYNPTETGDSTTYNTIKNKLGLTIPINIKKFHGGFKVFSDYEHIKINRGDSGLRLYNNLGVGSRIDINREGSFINKLGIGVKYMASGLNANDFEIRANGTLYQDSIISVILNASQTSLTPFFVQNNMTSNHYFWSNYFDKENHTQFSAAFMSRFKKMSFGLSFEQNLLSNYIYYDTISTPVQEKFDLVSITSFGLNLNFNLGNFKFNNKVNYQILNDEKIIHLPSLISAHQFYYERFAFKDAIKFQAGLELFYHSAYLSDKYNPAIRQFYLQDKVKTGNYPLVNLFINAKIKTMNIYLQVEHLNQGLSGKRYYGTINQPMTPLRLVLGAGWDLYY